MSDHDEKEKTSSIHEAEAGNRHAAVADQREELTGIKKLYYNPLLQISLLGFILFMGPGLFNALNGLGAGGQIDSKTSSTGNAILYACFAVSAFFAGSINNKLGSRLTLFLGALGYPLYIASYLAMELHPNPNSGKFVLAASGILGVCAGLLWSAHGSLVLAYPTEDKKGLYISICWSIFNMGAVIGSSVALGQNINSKENKANVGTYIGFLILTIIGACLPLFMADPKKVYRSDGSKVTINRNPTWKAEFKSQYLALRKDPLIVLLLPMFWASNWFYTWQFNAFNAALFTIRGRAVNNLVYWLTQIVGSVLIGMLLDSPKLNRRLRAFAGWALLVVMVFLVHIWGYFYQKDYTREETGAKDYVKIDLEDSDYPAHIWLYIFCGLMDSMWQTAAYWIMGAMSNDPAKLAYFAGIYKSFQSGGAAVAWSLDSALISYMSIFLSTWVLLAAGLALALPMIWIRVRNHTTIEDETLAQLDDNGRLRDPAELKAIAEGAGETSKA